MVIPQKTWSGLVTAGKIAAAGWAALVVGAASALGTSSAISVTALLTTPQAAQAYTSRATLFLSRNPSDSYDTFLRQAEAIARAGVQRSFDADPLVTEVIVTVIGENQGLAVPVMEVDVTRSDWQNRPDAQYWARYFETAPMLLEL